MSEHICGFDNYDFSDYPEECSLRQEILNNSHLSSSSNLARQYFAESGIDFLCLEVDDFNKLRSFIQIEISKLEADSTYPMIKKLRVKPKIINNKDGIFLRIAGIYFTNREGISFNINYNSRPLFIGFCAEMDGCNRIPFIRGFVKWVDFLKTKKEK